LTTLYFTTSKAGIDKMTPEEAKAAGHLFSAEPGAQGRPNYVFKG
jgi:sugar lactone lactonase YvrE